nr:hypothetical protein [Tanacetum cinerariifolium]
MERNLNHEQVTYTSSLSCSSREDRVVFSFHFPLFTAIIPGTDFRPLSMDIFLHDTVVSLACHRAICMHDMICFNLVMEDYDITSSLRRGALQFWYIQPGFETVGSKDLTCEDWMVNTRTDADLSTAVQNTLQTLLPQIREEICEEFRTGSGSSNAGVPFVPF